MGQLITLITDLFNLTKVAAVTLPGLLAAGGLSLILWPAQPIDVIPVVLSVDPGKTANDPACTVQHWAVDDIIYDIENKESQSSGLFTFGPDIGSQTRASFPKEFSEIVAIEDRVMKLSLPQARKQRVLEQFALDLEGRRLAFCIDLEKSRQGQEEKDITQLTSDADILEKQRSSAQDNYLAYLKSNNQELADTYKSEMRVFKEGKKDKEGKKVVEDGIDQVREKIAGKNRDLLERSRRVTEWTAEQQAIQERLQDPGRLRPRVGFDLFLTGLINHVVGFILLSLAAGLVVAAFDRAWFGSLYEDLFDGF